MSESSTTLSVQEAPSSEPSSGASSAASCPGGLSPEGSCPCGSGLSHDACCGPRLDGTKPPANPVELLRARYSAYCLKKFDYLVDTHLPPEGEEQIPAEVLAEHLQDVTWERLDILEEGYDDELDCPFVDFRAVYDMPDAKRMLGERSYFRCVDGSWYYVFGEPLKGESVRRESPKVGRNDPCPCGSGRKYKKCCGRSA